MAADGTTELPTEALTQAGLVVGTLPYMSPEQAKGEGVDHRSDIFSLGVMLFEMATGQRPFQGASSAELLSAVLKDTPPLLTEIKPELLVISDASSADVSKRPQPTGSRLRKTSSTSSSLCARRPARARLRR